MFAREYHIRAKRAGRAKLEGQQLDITFPRRGRPSKHRVLERCGQLTLNLSAPSAKAHAYSGPHAATANAASLKETPESLTETLDAALQMTFPLRPMTEDELTAEFHRLFPL